MFSHGFTIFIDCFLAFLNVDPGHPSKVLQKKGVEQSNAPQPVDWRLLLQSLWLDIWKANGITVQSLGSHESAAKLFSEVDNHGEVFFFGGGGSSVSCKEKFGLVCWRGDEFC